MAGKKKKSLANKLARMSDEERARYLLHKAEIEEEARKRKEQLIATFMKKKVKKEDAFSRLNLAKINQNWHQILRKIKVKDMKVEVEHLKKYIERLLDLKNRAINKNLKCLEEAEEQYLNNFNSHSRHINKIIDNQNDYINDLQSQYEEELKELLNTTVKERKSIIEKANQETLYLKTVIYGQNAEVSAKLKQAWENYSKRLYEVECANRDGLQMLRTTRLQTESALWKQISDVVHCYVEKCDFRRSHLGELRRIDAESAEEVSNNDETIKKKEELVKILTCKNDNLRQQRTDKIKSLETEEDELNVKFCNLRKEIKKDLSLDKKQLVLLTTISNVTINDLTDLNSRGRQLLILTEACEKYETEREKVSKWLPVLNLPIAAEVPEENEEIEGVTDDDKLLQKLMEKEAEDIAKKLSTKQRRSKTAICSRMQSEEDLLLQESTKKVPAEDIRTNFLDECYESLEKLETFWATYNKVEVDIIELKQERITLAKENKKLKDVIRAVLETAALTQTVPNSTVSTRAQSMRRSAFSAPTVKVGIPKQVQCD